MTRWLAAPNTTANTELLDTTMHSANTHNDASAINQTSRACVPYSALAALMRREVRFDGATVRNRPKIASSPRSLSIGQRGVEGPAGKDALDVGSDLVAGLSARHA
jgi:hypothetical protein